MTSNKVSLILHLHQFMKNLACQTFTFLLLLQGQIYLLQGVVCNTLQFIPLNILAKNSTKTEIILFYVLVTIILINTCFRKHYAETQVHQLLAYQGWLNASGNRIRSMFIKLCWTINSQMNHLSMTLWFSSMSVSCCSWLRQVWWVSVDQKFVFLKQNIPECTDLPWLTYSAWVVDAIILQCILFIITIMGTKFTFLENE